MREHNLAVVLRLIWDQPAGISRAELARRSGLSRSTVSAITAELIDEALIAEDRIAPSSGGRPPILLKFCEGRFALVGVQIGGSHVSCIRTDLRGRIEHHQREPWNIADDPVGTMNLVDRLVASALEGAAAHRVRVGIGIAVPSPLDPKRPGMLCERIFPAWRGVDIGAHIFARFGVAVLMDNDANLGALAEAWWGMGVGVPDFTFVKVASGVGAGHILGGSLFRGATGAAGEIGHCAGGSARPCRCGQIGCLEAEVGSRAIVEKATEALSRGVASVLRGTEPLSLAAVLAAARSGDALAIEVIHDAGRQLGIALANLVNLLNPARIILGGSVMMARDFLVPPLLSAMSERALAANLADTEVVVSDLPHGVARGAATLVLQWALDNACVAERLDSPEPAVRTPARTTPAQTLSR